MEYITKLYVNDIGNREWNNGLEHIATMCDMYDLDMEINN